MRKPIWFCLTALLLVAPRAARAADVDVDKYMNGLQFKPQEVLAVKAGGQVSAVKEPKETVDKQARKLLVTVLKPHSLDKNFDDIAILDPGKEIVYPGALVKVNRLLVQGTPQALTALNRNKERTLILNIDLPGLTAEEKSKVVRNPQAGSVQTAIEAMTTAWLDKYDTDEKKRTTILARMQSFDSVLHSEQQLAADLGLSVDTSQGSLSSKVDLKKNSTRKVAVIVFKQVFYTVSVNQPHRAADYLGKTAPEELLRDNVTAAEPPGYVHSVSYGRILMVRLESSADTTDGELDVLCNYAKGSAKIEAKNQTRYKNIFNNTTINTIVIGGGAKEAGKLNAASLEDLPEAVKTFIGKSANFTKANRGAPMAYTVYFLGGRDGDKSNAHVLARMSLHTNYTSEETKEYDEGLVVVEQKGWYVGRVTLTYEEYKEANGKWVWSKQEKKSGDLTLGSTFSHALPPRSRSVKLVVENNTGLAWRPWQPVSGLESKTFDWAPRIKFKTFGTTLNGYADPKEGEAIP